MQRGVIVTIVGLMSLSAVLLGLIWGAISAVIVAQRGAHLPGGLALHLAENVLMMLQWALGVGAIIVATVWLMRRQSDATSEQPSAPHPNDPPAGGSA